MSRPTKVGVAVSFIAYIVQGNTKKTKELNILYITMESAIFIERQKKRGGGGGGGDVASCEAAQITVSRNGFNLFLL